MSDNSKEGGIGIGGGLIVGLVALAVIHGCVNSCNAARDREAAERRHQIEIEQAERRHRIELEQKERHYREEQQRRDEEDAAEAIGAIGGAIIGLLLGD